jgi:phosphate transport system permease protein
MSLRAVIVKNILFFSAFISAAVTLGIFVFMAVLGLPLFREGLFLDMLSQPWMPHKNSYGIRPMILSTLSLSFLSVLIAFPLSLGCAAFVSVISPGKAGRFVKSMVGLMTGVPTVIYGFIGVFLLAPLVRDISGRGSGMCILTAAILLAILVSPTMILLFSSAFETIPEGYLRAVDALGGSTVQKFIYVILPHSWKGVLAGVTLSLGRAIGDTMIALMVAGNAVAAPASLFDPARPLTSHIAHLIAADFNSLEFKVLFLCGMALYLFTLLSAGLVNILSSGKKKEAL